MNNEFMQLISGSISALNGTIDLSSGNMGTINIQISGTWSGILKVQGSNNTNFTDCEILDFTTLSRSTQITTNGTYLVNGNGFQFIRIIATSWTSGSATIEVYATDQVTNLKVSGSELISLDSKITDYSRVSSGTLTALNQTVILNTIGLSAVAIQLTGTFVANCIIEATVDGTNYVSVNCSTQGGNGTTFSSARGDILFPCGGYTSARVRASAFTSGTVSVTLRGSVSTAGAIKIYQDSTSIFFTNSNTRDGSGNSITSQVSGSQRALDIGVNVAGVQVDPRLVTLQTGSNTIGSITNISGTVSLPTGASTETTLSALNTKINNLGSAVNTADIINVSGTQGTLSVTTTAAPIRVGGSNLANRKLVTFYHDTSNTVYWGYTSGVTTSTGTPLNRGQMTQWPVGPTVDIYLISTTTVAGRITEGA